MIKSPKILVIGAGAAGISAASRLLENGLSNVKIFEAQNRIGGRIHSVKLGDSFLDFGAQWCHGEKDNIVYSLAKDLNVLSISLASYTKNNYYDSSGDLIDDKIAQPLEDFFYETVRGDQEKAVSLGEKMTEVYKKKAYELFSNDKESLITANNLLEFFRKLTLCYEGALNWNEIAMGGDYELCEGEQLLNWKNKGYRLILDILMKKYPDASAQLPVEDKLTLNKEVEEIVWQDDDSSEVVVKCTDGTLEKFDHVILTSSLGVLKEHYRNMFKPALPPYKIKAIEGLSIGCVNKIFLKFPKRWWPEDSPGFSLVWKEEERKSIARNFGLGPVKDGRSWLEDIFGFYVVDSHKDVLMGWMVGEFCPEYEKLTDDVVSKGSMYLLKKFVGGKFDIPDIEYILRTKWYSNKHVRGAYSYASVKQKAFNVTNSDLAKPLSDKDNIPRLLFAGEATNSNHFSTVHGAIETGFREADRLLEIYRRGNLSKSNMSTTYKVAIVGAGLAGLGAAKTFVQNGIKNIVILEALEKPGGRIETVCINDNIIELGAQWLHSTSVSLHSIAKSNGFIHKETSDEGLGIYVRDDGLVFDDLLVKKVDFKIGEILEECEDFVDAIEYPNSVGDFVEQRFLSYLRNCDESDEVKNMKLELFDWNMLFQIIDNSCMDMKQVSTKQWGRYLCLGKDGQSHINIQHGYSALVDFIIGELPCDILKLKTAVKNIDYSESKIKITCQNKETIFADHVIVTSSIGYLKEKMDELFSPKLPRALSGCINAMGFCGIGKIFLVFQEKWWSYEGIQLIWRRNADIYGEESWTKFITGFDSVLEQPNILLAWVGGEGVEMMENLTEAIVGVHCVNLLRRFLLKNDIPYPIKVLRSTWLSCPWIRGGYSHATPECDRLGIGPGNLCEPISVNGVPKILLAGEAAHPNYFSTTHGAFESGQDQAKVLLDYLKNDNYSFTNF